MATILLLAPALAERVPVSALHLVPDLLWPAPAYRVLGPECEQAAAEAPVPEGKTLMEAQCYRLVVANPDDAATYLYFVARGLAAKFKLKEERMLGEKALVQLWQGEGGTLYLHFAFEPREFRVVAGWLVDKPKGP